MSRRAAAPFISQCVAMSGHLWENIVPSLPKSRWIYPLESGRLYFCSTRSNCSSHYDDLQGLVDSNSSFSGIGLTVNQEKKKLTTVTAKDFTILGESAAGCKPSSKTEYSEEAILISDAIRANLDDLDDKSLKNLRQFRGNLDADLVIEVLRLVKIPKLSVKFFLWAGRQIGYSHNTITYDALLDILGFNENSVVPQHFLREIEQEDREVLGRLLNVLIRKCCKNGFWNKAIDELGRLKDFGLRPSRTVYNALVRVLLSAGRLDSAVLVHREMLNSSCSMDRFTIGCFVHALCKSRRWEEALSVLEKEDFMLNTVLCTQMISGLMEASLFEEAMSLLHRLRSNSCVPNVVTYRTLLSGFLKQQQLGWCKRIVSMMIMEGCNPCLSLFNSLLHAYCTAGDYVYAYKLLKKMDECGYQPGYMPYNIFIGGICGKHEISSVMMELVEKVYDEMLNAGVVLNKANVVKFAECLCSLGKFDRAVKIILEMMRKGFVPDTFTYTQVIDRLCQASKVEAAFCLFEEMKSNGITPDVYTYTTLIDTFSKAGLIKQAKNWFDEMITNGCTPNVVTYTALIHAYLKSRRVSEANELFMNMLVMGCRPNIVTYSALIDGLCKAGNVDKSCRIYSKMRGTYEGKDVDMYFEDNSSNIIAPNVFTYGALVDGLCKAHKVVEAHDLLDSMFSSGCEPNNIVYDALVDGFCKVGKLDEAQKVFVRMSQHGHMPSVYTYSSLIDRLFKDKRLDLVIEILSKMLANSCIPNVVTYTEMIDGLCKVGKTHEAYKLFKTMAEKGSNPNVITYTAMIDGFGKSAEFDMCLELYRQMTTNGCAPNFITYTVLISHYCTAGLLDEALGILEGMKQTYWPIHVAGYGKVIEGFSRKFIASLGLLEDISNYSVLPVAPAYKILIGSFCQAGRLDEAFKLYKEVTGSSFSSPIFNLNTYSVFIEALCLASKVEKAFQLYSDLTLRGLVPELMILFCLVKGLLHDDKWEEALQLSYSICHMISDIEDTFV
ncbi:Pentatricopeptide repeat-containing protein [Platanthera guangdongensis]|uniref:Pentatricopeptide repeat-containing protein n=1 Tax=Platanthera guangdongensis TaxID=2320717 RepID=A0ABR2M3V4_9ASPA